jgi:hypothetical protein
MPANTQTASSGSAGAKNAANYAKVISDHARRAAACSAIPKTS